MGFIKFSVTLVAVALCLGPSSAFVPPAQPRTADLTFSSTRLAGFGDMFKGAFDNDSSLGKAENAGLKGGPKYNENVTINGKPVKAVVGQAVKVVANSARVKIAYNCQQGDCGTCMIKMNGRKVKACQMSIPAGKCSIETL